MIKLDQYISIPDTWRPAPLPPLVGQHRPTTSPDSTTAAHLIYLTSSNIYSTIMKQDETSPTYLSRKPAIHIHHHITDCQLPSL